MVDVVVGPPTAAEPHRHQRPSRDRSSLSRKPRYQIQSRTRCTCGNRDQDPPHDNGRCVLCVTSPIPGTNTVLCRQRRVEGMRYALGSSSSRCWCWLAAPPTPIRSAMPSVRRQISGGYHRSFMRTRECPRPKPSPPIVAACAAGMPVSQNRNAPGSAAAAGWHCLPSGAAPALLLLAATDGDRGRKSIGLMSSPQLSFSGDAGARQQRS